MPIDVTLKPAGVVHGGKGVRVVKLEPETAEDKLEGLQAVTTIHSYSVAALKPVKNTLCSWPTWDEVTATPNGRAVTFVTNALFTITVSQLEAVVSLKINKKSVLLGPFHFKEASVVVVKLFLTPRLVGSAQGDRVKNVSCGAHPEILVPAKSHNALTCQW